MFGNKYLYLAVVSINLACSVSYSSLEQFEGFPLHSQENLSASESRPERSDENTTATLKPTSIKASDEIDLAVNKERKEINAILNNVSKQPLNLTAPDIHHTKQRPDVKQFKIACPTNEPLQSIGSYVVPTQRELLLFTQTTLLRKLNSYHEKILFLLKDIKEAARSTATLEKKCYGRDKTLFKQCVKLVTKNSVNITKKSIQSLERQKAEIAGLTEDKICNFTYLNTNPIEQVKLVAMDDAVLEFALPSFLRLLGGCTVHCNIEPPSPDRHPRLRKATDQDLSKILTDKKYLRFIKNIKI